MIETRITVSYGAGPALKCLGSAWPSCFGQAESCSGAVGCLSCGISEIGGDDVGGVPIEAAAGAVVAHGGPGSVCEAASWTSRSGTPASWAAMMNACRSSSALSRPSRRPAPRSRYRPSPARPAGRAARSSRPCGNGPPPARQPRCQAVGAARGWAGGTRRLARPAHIQDNGSRAGPPGRRATRTPARPGRGRAGWVRDALSRAGCPPMGEHDGCAQDLAAGRDGRP